MALTGAFLVLFVTFHVLMNGVAIFWPTAYNVVCEMLGANWYALVGGLVLAAGFILHIWYASWLTIQNRRARGHERYNVTSRPPQVEWSSKNMYVLGLVIFAFLVVHLIQFWSKMQFAEILEYRAAEVENINGVSYLVTPAAGTFFLEQAFSCTWTLVIYLVAFVALWFHMTHGFWSMFQSCGWNGRIWLPRIKAIANWYTTIVVALFIAEAVVFTVKAKSNYYTTNEALIEQYMEMAAEYNGAASAPYFEAGKVPMGKFCQGHAGCPEAACPEANCPNAACPEAACPEANCANQCPNAVETVEVTTVETVNN